MRWRSKILVVVAGLFLYYIITVPLLNYVLNWKLINENRQGGLVWNLRTTLNLLNTKITPSNNISISGWWMDHSQCTEQIECNVQKWSLCTRALSCSCSSEKIRAVFQYIPIRDSIHLKGLDLSLAATSDINEENSRATLGAVVLVKLNNSAIETFKILFKPPIQPYSEHKAVYHAPPHVSINSATVMLICYGYSGMVKFSNMLLLPRLEPLIKNVTKKDVVNYCKAAKNRVRRKTHQFRKELLRLQIKENVQMAGHEITLTTHLSMDRLSTLERTIGVWKGPVSLVIFVPQKVDEEDGDTEWQKIYIQKKMKGQSFWPRSKAYLVFGHPDEHDYPINYLRNLALRNCETRFCFISDADFQPSPDLLQKFHTALKSVKNVSKTAFVVPAFEYTELPLKRDSIPQTKEELMQLLHTKEPFIQPFRLLSSPESHRLTNYYKWYQANKPYPVHTFNDKYEPYLILQKSPTLPKFDEKFTGYGMNKITFITELYAAKYTFQVLPDLWIIHLPHKYTSYAADFLQNPYQRLRNRFDRFEFVEEIMAKYRLQEC